MGCIIIKSHVYIYSTLYFVKYFHAISFDFHNTYIDKTNTVCYKVGINDQIKGTQLVNSGAGGTRVQIYHRVVYALAHIIKKYLFLQEEKCLLRLQ